MPGNDVAWRVTITLPHRALEPFDAAMTAMGLGVVARDTDETRGPEAGPGEVWCLMGYGNGAPDRSSLIAALGAAAAKAGIDPPEPSIEILPETDWVASVRQEFQPFPAGRFYVHGTDDAPPTGGVWPVMLDAGAAFGTGRHESTLGCLLALDRLARFHRVRRALDMGCGSGILAIAMARGWRRPVLACDNDPVAVSVARDNVCRNRVGRQVRAIRSDGYRHPAIVKTGPFDLICANILARPLARMAPSLAAVLAPGGMAVLAGLLAADSPRVLAAHRAQGLMLLRRLDLNGWTTLILRR